MRSLFTGYYSPTEDEYKTLWNEGLVVVDTNVLLDLYRLPASARDELIGVLENLGDRLWIPYQVALEFQRRRLSVIASERKATEDALAEANDLFEEVRTRVSSLQMEKRGLGLEPAPLIDELKTANDKLIEAINAVHRSQLDIAVSDPIRDKLDVLLTGKVGASPEDQAALDLLCEDGEERFSNKIPPGFEDAAKEKNPNEASFFHDSIRYERKFGDLILWRQLMFHAKENNIKNVLLVTSDRKEDWWWREKGKTVGPRPELSREIERVGEVGLFWMYSSSQFLENARIFVQANVSDQSVSQLEEVGRTSSPATPPADQAAPEYDGPPRLFRKSIENIEFAVMKWLSRRYSQVRRTRQFPDFIVERSDGVAGYDVKYVPHLERMLFAPPVINSMLRGYLEITEQRLSTFTSILVSDERDVLSIFETGRERLLDDRIDRLLEKYPISGIVAGFLDEGGDFVEITWRNNPKMSRHSNWKEEDNIF